MPHFQYNSSSTMNDKQVEKIETSVSSETSGKHEKGAEKPKPSAETKQKAAELLSAESSETVEGQEGVEVGGEKVSEATGEDRKKAPAGKGTTPLSNDQIEAIRAKLLAALPPQEVMIRQIRRKLRSEEKDLTKQMKKLKKKSSTQAFYLTIVVAKLRKVREYFSVLAHATYEMVKHLWLKIVHGV